MKFGNRFQQLLPFQGTSPTPKGGPRRSVLSMVLSSSRPSTITASPARSRTRLIFNSASGATRRQASSATGAGGARAVEHLRLVLAEVQIATVRNQVLLSLFSDFENFSVFKPVPRHEKSVNEVFDQVIAWGGALKTLREK